VNVDRPRQRDAVDCQFLIMDPIGREPGEQKPGQRKKTDDETQPNHSLTQSMWRWRTIEKASGVRRGGKTAKTNESQP